MAPSAGVIADSLDPTASQLVADVFLGPSVIGWILAIFGCGVSICNLLSYSQTSLYRNDPSRTRWSLWILTGFVLASASINAAQIWHYTVTQRRSFEALAQFQIIDCLPAWLQGCAQAIAQTLLAERAINLISTGQRGPRLSKAIWVLYFLIGCCLVFSFLEVIAAYLVRANREYLIRPLTFDIVDLVWFSLAALIDIIIAVILVVDFRTKSKQSEGAPAATAVLRKLIALSVYTASLTAFFAIGGAVASLVAQAGPRVEGLVLEVTLTFAAVLPSLYSLSLITTLRARKRLRARLSRDYAPEPGHWPRNPLPPLTVTAVPTDGVTQKVKGRKGRRRLASEGNEEKQDAREQALVVHIQLDASSDSGSTSPIGEKPVSPRIEELV